MLHEIIMPKSGMSMEYGTIIRWVKNLGDKVHKGEFLLEIETDKVSMEVESEADGILLKIAHKAGEEVPVTQVIGYIGDTAGEEIPIATTFPRSSLSTVASASLSFSSYKAPPLPGKIRATPAARRLARERGINLADITISEGGIYERDVARAQVEMSSVEDQSAPTHSAPSSAFSGPRKAVAHKMSESHAEVPPVTLYARARIDAVLDWKRQYQETRKERISLTVFFLRLFSHILVQHPALRRQLKEGKIITLPDIHLSVAVATSDGLFAPVIHHADTLDISTLSSRLQTLVEKTHKRTLKSSDLEGGVCTLSNLGMYEISFFTPMVTLPQSAILGVGSTEAAPFFTSQGTEFLPSVCYCLTVDHRIINGNEGASFLKDLVQVTQSPFDMIVGPA